MFFIILKHVTLMLALLICCHFYTVKATIISKSSKDECIVEDGIKNPNDTFCKSKLVVGITVSANEGKSQFIQANISRILDLTKRKTKNLELKEPIRIKVVKSPVLINYRLYQVGYVPNWPREEIKKKNGYGCDDKWYSNSNHVNCGFAYDNKGHKIFDSQGFCCMCGIHFLEQRLTRGSAARHACYSFNENPTREEMERDFGTKERETRRWIGHCLVIDELRYFVMGFYPPQFLFSINVTLEQRSKLTNNGSEVWKTVSQLSIGPSKTTAVSETHTVKVKYVADFYPSTFIPSEKISQRYLLIPDMKTLQPNKTYSDIPDEEWELFKKSVKNVSEWMAINKPFFDMTGYSCDKIGVSYTAFRHQGTKCRSLYGSCLRNQPYLLWKEEKRLQKERRKGQFMLHNFGKVHSLPHTKGLTDFQVNFIADRPTTSIIIVTMAADDLKVVNRVAPGRIISVFIDTFEALSSTGLLLAVIQNTGTFTSTYNVYIQHCSAGIDLIPSKVVTMKPKEMSNVSFVIHSFHALGTINHCQLNLYDANSRLIDNMTVIFETLDTCFCYGFCGCACGTNKTICPDAPKRPDSEIEGYVPTWLERLKAAFEKFKDFFVSHGSKFLILFWVILIGYCLGCLKVIHIIITQEIKMDMILHPAQLILQKAKEIAKYIYKELCPMICDNFWTSCGNCCAFCAMKCICCITLGKCCRIKKVTGRRRIERGWRAPTHCNGMCDGARFRRRVHRKLMRVNKRAGMIKDIPWFSKPYNCTCKVKDQMPCIMICKGLFFFFYCPLLPIFWTVEFIFKYIRRKWRKFKRIKKFRTERAEREKKKQQAYVHLDKYSRGQLESDIVNLDREVKELRQLEKEYEADMTGFNPDLEDLQLDKESENDDRNASSDGSILDTSDPDHSNDIDELLNPGFPVYMNFAIPQNSHALQKPGESYSLKGRLTEDKTEESTTYFFDLHIWKCQIKQQINGKAVKLKQPKQLLKEDFIHSFGDQSQLMRLVTVAPLFTCLNGVRKKKKQVANNEKKT